MQRAAGLHVMFSKRTASGNATVRFGAVRCDVVRYETRDTMALKNYA